MLDHAAGRDVPAEQPYPASEVWDHLAREVQQEMIAKQLTFWVIDADAVADVGMGNRINTVMQPCFFQLAGILPADVALARIKESVEQSYGRRSRTIVERNSRPSIRRSPVSNGSKSPTAPPALEAFPRSCRTRRRTSCTGSPP